MRLYIVRHGKADRDSPTGRDSDRPLRPRGIRQATWLGQELAVCDKPPRLVLSSPLVRAIDTARILHTKIGCPLEVFDQLSGGDDAGPLIGLIAAHAELGSIALVGHNPQLSILANLVAERGTQRSLELRTGEGFVFDFKGSPGAGTARFRRALRMDDED